MENIHISNEGFKIGLTKQDVAKMFVFWKNTSTDTHAFPQLQETIM